MNKMEIIYLILILVLISVCSKVQGQVQQFNSYLQLNKIDKVDLDNVNQLLVRDSDTGILKWISKDEFVKQTSWVNNVELLTQDYNNTYDIPLGSFDDVEVLTAQVNRTLLIENIDYLVTKIGSEWYLSFLSGNIRSNLRSGDLIIIKYLKNEH